VADEPVVLHNGTPVYPAVIPLTDPIVMRGDGCFEAVRSYRGALIGLEQHLARLEASASALEITLPPRTDLRAWVQTIATGRGDGVVRLLASPSGDVYVFSTPVPDIPESYRMMPVPAPWHPGGQPWELAGVKTLSYAPNMGATRVAQAAGFDEALLITSDGIILESPTAGVIWMVDGTIETAEADLGILTSVTVEIILASADGLGIDVCRGAFPLDRLDEASEIAILSTTREIVPVVAVGDCQWVPGPVTAQLAGAYQVLVAAAVGNRNA